MAEVSIIHKLDVNSASLPAVYERAKTALVQCCDLDECKDWSDKAHALASYARQANDDELNNLAIRIRARAMRRCGELLKMFDGKGNNQHKEGNHLKLTKSEIGTESGLSEHQIKTANRLANIPENEFEQAIESDTPPTITELSEEGKRIAANREYLSRPKPEGFADQIHFRGSLEYVLEFTDQFSPEYLINGMEEWEKSETISMINKLLLWFDLFKSK